MKYAQAFRAEEIKKGKDKMANIISLFFPKDNRLFNGVFIISNLFIISMVGSEAERKYQNIIKKYINI